MRFKTGRMPCWVRCITLSQHEVPSTHILTIHFNTKGQDFTERGGRLAMPKRCGPHEAPWYAHLHAGSTSECSYFFMLAIKPLCQRALQPLHGVSACWPLHLRDDVRLRPGEVRERLPLDPDIVGRVIGKGGETIKRLEATDSLWMRSEKPWARHHKSSKTFLAMASTKVEKGAERSITLETLKQQVVKNHRYVATLNLAEWCSLSQKKTGNPKEAKGVVGGKHENRKQNN